MSKYTDAPDFLIKELEKDLTPKRKAKALKLAKKIRLGYCKNGVCNLNIFDFCRCPDS